MPEWVMLIATFAVLTLCGFVWQPFLYFAPLFLLSLALWLAVAVRAGLAANLRFPCLKNKTVVAFLHLAQPLVRLQGRLSSGMTPWRSRCNMGFRWPLGAISRIAASNELSLLEENKKLAKRIKEMKLPALRGAAKSLWDWQIEGGIFAGARLLLCKRDGELVVKTSPYLGMLFFSLLSIAIAVTYLAIVAKALPILAFASLVFLSLIYRAIRQCGEAFAASETLLARTEFATPSLWEQFQPPKHFFEAALKPKDKAFALARELASIQAGATATETANLGANAEGAPAAHCSCAWSRCCF
jgi:hypothetical protein